MNYKGYEISDKMNYTEIGAELHIEDGDEKNFSVLTKFIEDSNKCVEKMKSEGFVVTDNVFNTEVKMSGYGEEGECSFSVDFLQVIYREETELEREVRIKEEKEYYDHLDELMKNGEKARTRTMEREFTDKKYALYKYQMEILKQYDGNTISYEKWCEKNKILSK